MKPTLTLAEVAVLMRLDGPRVERKALRRVLQLERESDSPLLEVNGGEANGKRYVVLVEPLRRAMPGLFVGAPEAVDERRHRGRVDAEVDARFEAVDARHAELHTRDDALAAEIVELRREVEVLRRAITRPTLIDVGGQKRA